MKRLFFLFAILFLEAAVVHADDQTRNVQTQLKDKGFYYGEVDGKSGSELSAAIRRYQIRNGLEVSGELNKETLDSLGIAGTAVRKAQPVAKRPQPEMQETPEAQSNPAPAEEVRPRPPVNLRRSADAQESDVPRPVAPRGTIPPPAPLDEGNAIAPTAPAGPYSDVFAGTPYASAPRIVQESTLRRAQQALAQRGFYREAITGIPGPALEEAVLTYQRSARLQLSGRLDLQTLASLHLLPVRGGSGNPQLRPFYPQGADAPRQVYRGVWVN